MKKHILPAVIAFISTSTAIASVTESADTILNVTNPSKMIITETPHGIMVKVDGNDVSSTVLIAEYDNNTTITSSQTTSPIKAIGPTGCSISVKSGSHWNIISGGLNLGLVNSLNQPDGMDLKWSKSIEIGWVNAIALRYRYRSISLSLGLGFDWRNYNMTNNRHHMVQSPGSGIILAPYPEGARPGNSRIKIFSLGFPLLYTQHIPGTTLSITAGGILNLNTHASLKTCYKNEYGNHIEEYAEGIKHRKVSADIYGMLHLYKGVGIYARYSPQTVLSGTHAPKFKPLSVGISLFM